MAILGIGLSDHGAGTDVIGGEQVGSAVRLMIVRHPGRRRVQDGRAGVVRSTARIHDVSSVAVYEHA